MQLYYLCTIITSIYSYFDYLAFVCIFYVFNISNVLKISCNIFLFYLSFILIIFDKKTTLQVSIQNDETPSKTLLVPGQYLC